MRIAYICADYGVPVLGGKGGSIHVREMVAGLAGAGHEVTLFCTRLGEGDPGRIPARIVQIGRAPAGAVSHMSVGTDSDASCTRERFEKERGWMAGANALQARVLQEHREQPFDLLYERYGLWSRAGAAVSAATGIPLVLEVNAPLIPEALAYRALAALSDAETIEREMFASAAAVVAVSDAVKAYVVEKGAGVPRVHVVPNGVDTGAFHAANTAAPGPWLGRGPVIGFVGGLKQWHGLQELALAFRALAPIHPAAQLLVVGDGPMRGWIDGFSTALDLADRIHVTGWVPHGELPRYLAAIDVATAPYPRLDGFYFSPLKLFEYLAAGRAIVASRIGQIDGVIRHGENGLLVDPGDIAALTSALSGLVADGDMRRRLGKAARASAARHTWRDTALRVAAIGAELVGQRSAGAAGRNEPRGAIA